MLTQLEIEGRFATEEGCVNWLLFYRYREGFTCPACASRRAWQLKARPVMECRDCGRQTSATAGTIFHKTRTPLRVWFRIIADMMTSKAGCSAKEVARKHRLRYETAWTILHKVRSAFGQERRGTLGGTVEWDVRSALLSEESDRRQAPDDASIVVAIEKTPEGPGRLRMARYQEPRNEALLAFAATHIDDGPDTAVVAVKADRPRNEQRPMLRRVFSLFQRVQLGTHQGAVSPKHCQRYIDEFVFRFNRRRGRPYLAFVRVFEFIWQRSPTYDDLVSAGA